MELSRQRWGSHPAEAEATQRNAELRRAQGRVEIAIDALRDLGATLAVGHKLLELRVADLTTANSAATKKPLSNSSSDTAASCWSVIGISFAFMASDFPD